jgi:enterochelin esterase family protein
MIMVSTLGYGTSSGPGRAMTADNLRGYERILMTEVMPVIEKAYNVSRNRTQRAIAGLSMGGATSTFVGLNHLDQFAWIGSFSGAFLLWPANIAPQGEAGSVPGRFSADVAEKTFPNLTARSNASLRLLWIACGTADGLNASNREFKAWLTAKGVKFTDVETEGAHTWDVWRKNLTTFAPLLFK